VPHADANGVARLLVEVVDDYLSPSEREVLEIHVLPINDAPWFKTANWTGVVIGESERAVITASVADDKDYRFGETVRVTYSLVAPEDADEEWQGGRFTLPDSSSMDYSANCTLNEDASEVVCEDRIERLNDWLLNGIILTQLTQSDLTVLLKVDDLGNIDKLDRPLDGNTTLLITLGANTLLLAEIPESNAALIGGVIAGVLAAGVIAALAFAFRHKKAQEAAEAYFDDMMIGMEGTANESPLYQSAQTGGESPIYASKPTLPPQENAPGA